MLVKLVDQMERWSTKTALQSVSRFPKICFQNPLRYSACCQGPWRLFTGTGQNDVADGDDRLILWFQPCQVATRVGHSQCTHRVSIRYPLDALRWVPCTPFPGTSRNQAIVSKSRSTGLKLTQSPHLHTTWCSERVPPMVSKSAWPLKDGAWAAWCPQLLLPSLAVARVVNQATGSWDQWHPHSPSLTSTLPWPPGPLNIFGRNRRCQRDAQTKSAAAPRAAGAAAVPAVDVAAGAAGASAILSCTLDPGNQQLGGHGVPRTARAEAVRQLDGGRRLPTSRLTLCWVSWVRKLC